MIVSKGKSENSINRKETFHPSLVLTFLFQIVRLLFYLVQAHGRLRIVVDRQHVPRHRDVQKLSTRILSIYFYYSFILFLFLVFITLSSRVPILPETWASDTASRRSKSNNRTWYFPDATRSRISPSCRSIRGMTEIHDRLDLDRSLSTC